MDFDRSRLKQYFLEGSKKKSDLKIGVEWEKIGVYKDTGRAISYSGERGVEAIFRSLIRRFGWEPICAGPHIIALKKPAGSITLEPGGQIELSGTPARTLDKNAAELCAHLEEIKKVSEPLGIAWLGIGAQPVSVAGEIEWVPKERYAIMRKILKNKGSLTHAMMKETASVQISIDFTSEEDAIEKLRLALGLAPILSGMFANSPLRGGRPGPYLSRRAHIWRHTAPERTGILPDVFRPDYTLEDYIDFALQVPLLFIVRQGRWIAVRNQTFGKFLRKGFENHRAAPRDWELHLTTIFTEARLKKVVEIRGIDCQKTGIALSAPALLKGLFYDEAARKEAWGLVSDWTVEERLKLARAAARDGVRTKINGEKRLGDLAKKLVGLAEKGLKREEARYLDPLKEILRKDKCPADILLDELKNAWGKPDLVKKILASGAI